MAEFRAERPQGVVDGVGDGRRRSNRAAFADAFRAEPCIWRRRLHVDDARRRRLGRAGQKVVGEGRGKRLAGPVEQHFLVERSADTLRESAPYLAVDDQRIDEHAAVLDHDIVEDLDIAEVWIDGHRDGVSRIAEYAGITDWLISARCL